MCLPAVWIPSRLISRIHFLFHCRNTIQTRQKQREHVPNSDEDPLHQLDPPHLHMRRRGLASRTHRHALSQAPNLQTPEIQGPLTGAYYGSSHTELGYIANIEPLTSKLNDIAAGWAAKACRSRDPNMRDVLEARPSRGFPTWQDGTGKRGFQTDCPISSAFYLTAIGTPEKISRGDITDVQQASVLHIQLLSPEDKRPESKGPWAAMLGQIQKEGWDPTPMARARTTKLWRASGTTGLKTRPP